MDNPALNDDSIFNHLRHWAWEFAPNVHFWSRVQSLKLLKGSYVELFVEEKLTGARIATKYLPCSSRLTLRREDEGNSFAKFAQLMEGEAEVGCFNSEKDFYILVFSSVNSNSFRNFLQEYQCTMLWFVTALVNPKKIDILSSYLFWTLSCVTSSSLNSSGCSSLTPISNSYGARGRGVIALCQSHDL
jgi:hypothetical protein